MLGVDIVARPATDAPFHPGRTAALVAAGEVIGFAGELHPRVIATYSLPARTVALELDLDALVLDAADVVGGDRVAA
jgi:phenylalanyl-tRNA synthetase beta chain